MKPIRRHYCNIIVEITKTDSHREQYRIITTIDNHQWLGISGDITFIKLLRDALDEAIKKEEDDN